MNGIWKTALASFLLIGFTAVVSAAAIAVGHQENVRVAGEEMMVDASYALACSLGR